MTLEEYDRRQIEILRTHCQILDLQRLERKLEDDCLKEAGIVFISRDPGFPCWTTPCLSPHQIGYHNTPREALAALIAAKEKA